MHKPFHFYRKNLLSARVSVRKEENMLVTGNEHGRYLTYPCPGCGVEVSRLTSLGTYSFPGKNKKGYICPDCGADVAIEERRSLCGQEV
jgi:predicted RNA-binding Zn-ribbon protein involved in translation (DUF1610 family)